MKAHTIHLDILERINFLQGLDFPRSTHDTRNFETPLPDFSAARKDFELKMVRSTLRSRAIMQKVTGPDRG